MVSGWDSRVFADRIGPVARPQQGILAGRKNGGEPMHATASARWAALQCRGLVQAGGTGNETICYPASGTTIGTPLAASRPSM